MTAAVVEASAPVVLVVGNPNAGKSTLFNALTGGRARVGNFVGTTVERKRGALSLAGAEVVLVDVLGTFSLAARSPEERIAIDSVLGLEGQPAPDALVVVADAPRVLRSLYLVLQLLELEVPLVVALNLMDEARAEGRAPDVEALADLLGVPVIPMVARTGEGTDALRSALAQVLDERPTPGCPHGWSDALVRDADEVAAALPTALAAVVGERAGRARGLALWLLLSVDGEDALELPEGIRSRVRAVRERAQVEGRDIVAEIVGTRYAWIDARGAAILGAGVTTAGPRPSDRIDRVLLHPVWGTAAFLSVMSLVFTALFSWSDPAIALIEVLFGLLAARVAGGFDGLAASLPALAGPVGLLGDLIVEGVIGGVGAVVVFLPQIGLLFLFLALLEDCGYLARAAHLMDRILRAAGLPGQAFVPLLSGYACAVPAILATRTLPRFRDRLLTMMVIPLTSCSARLPIYTLLIAALFPASLAVAGLELPLRPLALLGMYLFSTAVAVGAAIVLGRTLMRDAGASMLLELPPYRVPHPRTVLRLVVDRCADFLREAGRIILVATIVLWALLSFPRYDVEELLSPEVMAAAVEAGEDPEALAVPLRLERSFAGRMGKVVEPVIAPLGYDWRIGVGLIGAFAAREVFVATMGLVHGVGEGADEESVALRERMRRETRADGSPLYTPLVGASLMVFFALAMQCLSTMAVLRKETGGWRWPAFILVYMSSLAWVGAFAVYQGGRLLGLAG